MSRPQTSVGIEIELNYLPNDLSVNWDLWSRGAEHCGIELRTSPCYGFKGLRNLKKSIKQMEKSKGAGACGFNNAGTHIHIDFLNDFAKKDYKNLKRKAAKLDEFGERYLNPTGSGKKWYWVDGLGGLYSSPSKYQNSGSRRPADVYRYTKSNKHTLLAVKRFMVMGVRFSDVLFGLQHPDRRFNKYCHTLEHWNENILFKQTSIQKIAMHQNLQQGHRRHMFNVMAFEKWGTIEIRMLKASLSTKEIWAQLMLFTRMARLARDLSIPIPPASGLITKDFTTLLNFTEMHGKYRKVLVDMFGKNLKAKDFNCFCFKCYLEVRQSECYDYGLSRAVCRNCHSSVQCICCGRAMRRDLLRNKQKVDDIIDGGRWSCVACVKGGLLKNFIESEASRGAKLSLGKYIGSGYDGMGMRQLRRMRELYT